MIDSSCYIFLSTVPTVSEEDFREFMGMLFDVPDEPEPVYSVYFYGERVEMDVPYSAMEAFSDMEAKDNRVCISCMPVDYSFARAFDKYSPEGMIGAKLNEDQKIVVEYDYR